jgi:O-antigen ligase
MGTEILVLFIPIVPILFFWDCWMLYQKRNNLKQVKRYIFLFIITFLMLAHALYSGLILLAFYGLLFFIVLIFCIPVIILAMTADKRVEQSQWSSDIHGKRNNDA